MRTKDWNILISLNVVSCQLLTFAFSKACNQCFYMPVMRDSWILESWEKLDWRIIKKYVKIGFSEILLSFHVLPVLFGRADHTTTLAVLHKYLCAYYVWSTDIATFLEVLSWLFALVSGFRRIVSLVFSLCIQLSIFASFSLVVRSFRFPHYSVVCFVGVTVVTVNEGFPWYALVKLVDFFRVPESSGSSTVMSL